MRDPAHEEPGDHGASAVPDAPPEVWTGRATNRVQWLLACAGAACLALGIELAVGSIWTSGFAPLLMSVVGCIAVGLLMLFGTLAFVHVAVKVDKDFLEVRCGHLGLPRRHIPLSHVVARTSRRASHRGSGAAGATAGGPRRARPSWSGAARAWCSAWATATSSR